MYVNIKEKIIFYKIWGYQNEGPFLKEAAKIQTF